MVSIKKLNNSKLEFDCICKSNLLSVYEDNRYNMCCITILTGANME